MSLLKSSLLPLVFLAGGALVFKEATPNKCELIRDDDTLFVLTGDSRRIPYAMRLLENHPNRHLEIVGVGGHEYSAFIPEGIKDQVELETLSKSTYENSVAVRQITLKKGLLRIVIVTTEDHINRSMLLIKRQLPNTSVIPCPVKLLNMPPKEKLLRWGKEYIKYIATLFGLENRA